MSLNPHEQELLAAIEKDLTEDDPRLARVIARSARCSSELPSFPLRRRHLITLASALIVLILVHALVADIHPAASAALTCGLAVTWLASVTRDGTSPAAAHDGQTSSRVCPRLDVLGHRPEQDPHPRSVATPDRRRPRGIRGSERREPT